MLNLNADLHFSSHAAQHINFQRYAHSHIVQLAPSERVQIRSAYLLFMLLSSLSVSTSSPSELSERMRARAEARVCRRDSLWQMYREFDPVCERTYARLHTDTRERMRACNYPRASCTRGRLYT